MITKFGSLFAGHVDLDNEGFDGTAANGLVISDIDANAALGRVGFREGDRIISVAGQQILNEADFIRFLRNRRQGRVDVIVLRDGQQQTLYLEPALVWQQVETVQFDPLEQFGLILDDRYTDRLVVWRVVPRSPAFYAGIRPGDVITSFGGQSIATPAAFVQLVERTDPGLVAIQVNRNGRPRTINANFQLSQRHDTYRQNLDADVQPSLNTSIDARGDGSVRYQNGTMQSDVNAGGQVEARPTYPQRTYNYRTYPARRGLFRRR
jgi:S1-C subfamily serine protease